MSGILPQLTELIGAAQPPPAASIDPAHIKALSELFQSLHPPQPVPPPTATPPIIPPQTNPFPSGFRLGGPLGVSQNYGSTPGNTFTGKSSVQQ